MRRVVLSAMIPLAAVLLGACSKSADQIGQMLSSEHYAEKENAPKDAGELSRTIVTQGLDQAIKPGKNVLWCEPPQLVWNEPFTWSFETVDDVMFAGEFKLLTAFGIPPGERWNPALARRAGQVKVIWHCRDEAGGQQFVVELKAGPRGDRLILALLDPGKTLGETVEKVSQLLAHPDPLATPGWNAVHPDAAKFAMLQPTEPLIVPVIDLNVFKDYPQPRSQPAAAGNPQGGPPRPAAPAKTRQLIRFRLDEKGANPGSWAANTSWGRPLRDFTFSRPFLVVLLKPGAAKPCFALWIGNTELLVPVKLPDDGSPPVLFR